MLSLGSSVLLSWDAPRGPLGVPTLLWESSGDKLIVVCMLSPLPILGNLPVWALVGALRERVPVYSPTLRRCSTSGARRLEPGSGLQPDSPGNVGQLRAEPDKAVGLGFHSCLP